MDPISFSIIIETCMPLKPSTHTAFCGVPVKKPSDWTVMTANAIRPRTMTAPVSHFRDFVEFVFIINKYLLFFDMQIYVLLLKNNNFIKNFDKYLFFVPVGGILATCFLLSSTQTVLNVESNVTNTPAVRKCANITDELTQNLRLVRKSAHFTDGLIRNLRLVRKSAHFTDDLTRNLRLIRKSAHFTDDLTRNLRLIRKCAHITDKRTQKIQVAIKSQQSWDWIERPQIKSSLKLNLHDKMLNMLDI